MRRSLPALVLLALMSSRMSAAQALDWAGLWRTPDQRGESLLRQGDAAKAATVYKDPRRKAYAELQAGNYAAAAQDLAAFDDSDAEYNRGNALAHAGDLQGAIGAYDAALKRDPHNRDAAHNRELVQNALKQQPPQQQPSNSGQSGPDKSKQGQPEQNNPGQGNAGDQNSSSQGQSAQGLGNQQGDHRGASAQDNSAPLGAAGDRQQPGKQPGNQAGNQQSQQAQGSSAQAGKPGAQEQGGSGRQDRSGANGQTQSNQTQSNQTQSNQAQSGQQQQRAADAGQAAPGRDDAEQARRDAEAGLGRAGDQIGGDRNGSPEQNGSLEQHAPQTEQQLAEQQWLHSIPDDPGGLLRRKFMIEHMLRQQKVQP